MPTAKLSVTLPEGVWIREVSRAYPDAVFRVLAALPDEDVGVGLLEIEASDLGAVLSAVEGADGVTSLDPLQATERDALVQFETTEPLLLLAVRNSRLPLELPMTIRDGRADLTITAPRDRLSTFADQLESFGMRYEVEYVRQSVDSTDLLTEGQREILSLAAERGYYDTPRECTLTDLAEELGVAKSTASERLHRAEGTVLREFVDSTLDADL
jgi:hypothetical protein